MKTVLVTGPIGSGKSVVCRILAGKGRRVYDCDSRCKALYDEVPGLKSRIESELGIPFSRLSSIFEDSARREKLESIVYPVLIEDFKNWRSRSDDDCFMESAVAANKAGFDGLYDEIWLVTAPVEMRIARNPKTVERDGLQNFEHLTPTRIIRNDSSLEDLKEQIEKLI